MRPDNDIEAIYEDGKLVLPHPLSLPEKVHVRVTIETDLEHGAWLKLSEESLTKTLNNDADDVFNELLKKNDIVLLPIPFTDLTSRKVRPAVVLGHNGADLFPAPFLQSSATLISHSKNGAPLG